MKDNKDIPEISVIIPMYNAENYIEIPINSLLNQSYKNFEVVLVDDGSTDASTEVAKKVISNDKRFRILRQKNSGPGAARNHGIREAKGNYISFIDSDDYFHQEFLYKVIQKSKETEADVIVCDFVKVYENGEIIQKYLHPYKLISNFDAFVDIIQSNNLTSLSQNKIFKKHLFQNIEYPEDIIVNEDVATIYRLILEANKVAFVNESLFFYVFREGSSINNFNRKRLDDRINVAEIIKKDLQSRDIFNKYIKEYNTYYLLNVVLFAAIQICKHAKNWHQILKEHLNNVDRNIFKLKNIFLFWRFHKNKILPMFCLKINIYLFGILIRRLK